MDKLLEKAAAAVKAVYPEGPASEIAEAVLKALDEAMGAQPSPEMFEGIHSPVYCPRGLDGCESLNQIVAAGHRSFICCGEHGQGKIPQDRYRLCFKNADIDDMQDYDSRDVIQTAAVLMGAAALIAERTVASDRERRDG